MLWVGFHAVVLLGALGRNEKATPTSEIQVAGEAIALPNTVPHDATCPADKTVLCKTPATPTGFVERPLRKLIMKSYLR